MEKPKYFREINVDTQFFYHQMGHAKGWLDSLKQELGEDHPRMKEADIWAKRVDARLLVITERELNARRKGDWFMVPLGDFIRFYRRLCLRLCGKGAR